MRVRVSRSLWAPPPPLPMRPVVAGKVPSAKPDRTRRGAARPLPATTVAALRPSETQQLVPGQQPQQARASQHVNGSRLAGPSLPAHSTHLLAHTWLADAAPVAAVAMLLLAGGGLVPWMPLALASEGVQYNPMAGSEALKTAAGVVYIAVVAIFFLRLFRRRAQQATSERIASVADAAAYGGTDDDSDDEEDEEQKAKAQEAAKDVTPLQSFIGAAQAGVICYLFFQASTGVDAFFDRQALPDINTQYTAHNITVLVQTVCRGLVYLITFIFGANAVGLAGLTIQLLLDPEYGREQAGSNKQAPKLPKVSVTDDVFALRRAFQEAERMGQQQARTEIDKSRSGEESDGRT